MNILNVGEKTLFDNSIVNSEKHTHQPYSATSLGNNDEIRIPIQQQDVYTLPSESLLYIEGKLVKSDGAASSTAKFVNNGIGLLFDEIRYEIGGYVLDRVRNPGLTSIMKGYVSFNANETKRLQNSGWFPMEDSTIVDKNGNFNVIIKLSMLLGFCEDFKKVILNLRQELVLIRASFDTNAIINTTKDEVVKVILNKVLWKVPHISVADSERLKLINYLARNNELEIPFRSWELHEYPLLQETMRHSWSIKTATPLEKPRYVIVGFQSNCKNKVDQNYSIFDHGKPLPKVSWYRNDILVSNVSVTLPGGGSTHVRSELRISGLGRRDVHSELTCQAINNPRTQPLAATLHVDMNFGPVDAKILGSNQPLSAARRYDLLCQSSGSRPPASITWWKNGQRMDRTKETTSSDGNTTTSTLSFTPKKDDDGKYLSCRAENKMLSTEGLEDGWKLEIQYTPEARIILGTSLNPDAIREGTDVYFDCIINAHPHVYKVEWRHNGKVLLHNVGLGIIISNQSLVLQGVSRSTAGNYTCVGYNTEGDGESEPFYLNVMYAPTCKPNQTRVHGVAKQEEARITCQVDANPPDVQFKWTFNNSADSTDVSSTHIARSGTSSVVSYTPITELDYGTLLCYSSNKIGHQRIPCVFHIIAAGRPDQVHNCSVYNVSMTSFSVKCSEGFNGGLPQSFLLEVRESQSQEIKSNLSSPVARFSVTALEPGAHYQAGLYSFNSKGRSEPVVLQAATLRLPEKQLTAERENTRNGFRFTPMTSVLIGVISALLIVALVIILVLRLQCSHNEGRRRRHKNAAAAGALEHRGSTSGIAITDKSGGSPISKHDSNGDCDSDEKNPDIIPQPIDVDDGADYIRKRQHVSTIETSPSRSLLHTTPNSGGGYIGYCTLRNGLPLHDITAQSKMSQMVGPYTQCTLPRQAPQQWQYGPIAHLPPNIYPVPQYRGAHTQQRPRPSPREPPIPMQPLAIAEEEASVETPLMVNKRESTV